MKYILLLCMTLTEVKKGMNIKMQKVNKKILLSIIIIWIIFGVTVSFAIYKTNLNIQYKSNT